MTFAAFFRSATPNDPYPWQTRLGEIPTCQSRLIDIPTGLGKTAGVTLAWLYNRLARPEEASRKQWPRRLVYCLPMRTLVEQTEGEVRKWIDALVAAGVITNNEKPRVVILMGGESPEGRDKDWDLHPEAPAILIGTQDMLLSRALNRGYGMSRYRWPIHYALLNNDALWIMDEVQLMGVGVETSAQLQGLRERLGTHTRCHTWWMSATLDPRQLGTIDFREAAPALPRETLDETDRQLDAVNQREAAQKPLQAASTSLSGNKKEDLASYSRSLATEAIKRYREHPDQLTLVIVNRVPRAQEIFAAIAAELPAERRLLIHSRFREQERTAQRDALTRLEREGGIVVATQAIEAGVDLSAAVLFTELAPWPSLVQRFGRANRKGELNDSGGAQLYWIDLPDHDDLALPYTVDELKVARELLCTVPDASPLALSKASLGYQPPLPIHPVVRRKDVVELFDTTPDLTGSDIDVSRYIRENDDTDVLVYWLPLPEKGPPPAEWSQPPRAALCRVPVGQFNAFLKKQKPRVFRWNPTLVDKNSRWEYPTHGIPGQTYLIDAATPGYAIDLGWTVDKAPPLAVEAPDNSPADDNDADEPTFTGCWETIHDHTAAVMAELASLATTLALDPATQATLADAARWHDAGKAHPVFRDMLAHVEDLPPDFAEAHWAKSRRPKNERARYARPGFRHELASALLYRAAPQLAQTEQRTLAAYLIAAHHGKVRVGLRSLPGETKPDGERLFARGVWDGDDIPAADTPPLTLPGLGEPVPTTALDLACIRLGANSWAADALALLETHGPFALAYLETLLRAADGRASSLASLTTIHHD